MFRALRRIVTKPVDQTDCGLARLDRHLILYNYTRILSDA